MHRNGNLTWKVIKWETAVKLSTSRAHYRYMMPHIRTGYHRTGEQWKKIRKREFVYAFHLLEHLYYAKTQATSTKIIVEQVKLLLKLTYLSDTMFPSSAGKLRILLEDRSRYTRLWSLAMSEGIRDKELSLRCKAVKWVSVHNDELKLLTFPVEGR